MINIGAICIFITFLVIELSVCQILINLPNGTIQGKQSQTFLNKTYYSFEKVPYASPPVGKLRFKAPVPPQNWDGVLDATQNTVICYQVNADYPNESEDCLYVNIYTPRLPADDSPDLPVIFYIHGGGFILGTCLENICGPQFFIDYDVVVVTITYRLGPFGFLSTQDEIIPGNNGLRDQHLGIKWTHENIGLFGGDPNKITIVGESAGAASVTYQFLYPKSEGLFRAAIAESGSFLSPWSFQRKAREYAFRTAGFIDQSFNNKNNSQELYEFLMSVNATELDQASYQVNLLENLQNRQINQGYFYAPVIEPEHEDAFITRKMYGDLKRGNFVKVPTIIGINSEEALQDAANLTVLRDNMMSYDENLDWLVPDDLNIEDEEEKILIGKFIRSIYTRTTFEEDLAAGIRYSSDTSFTRSVIKHAELQSKFTDVYFYQFSYDGEMGGVPIILKGADRVAHTEELRYMWVTDFDGYDNTNINEFPKDDIVTHYRMLTLWSNFVKTLNPTPENSELLENIKWPSVSSHRPKEFFYLDINNKLSLKSYPKVGTYLGWNLIYNLFGNGDFDTF